MYKKWEELMENADKELLNTEMEFSSIDKGVMHYFGNYQGKKVYCSVSETCIHDYDYTAREKVSSVTQGYYVWLTVDDEEVLNTH